MRDTELVEILAEWSHKSWSGWTRYMIDKWSPDMIERWERQITTPYAKLTETEKESDQGEAREIIEILRACGVIGLEAA